MRSAESDPGRRGDWCTWPGPPRREPHTGSSSDGRTTSSATARRASELGLRARRPDGVGRVPPRGRHVDSARSGPLRGAPGCRVAGRHAGPVALVPRSCRCLAQGGERAVPSAARGIRIPKIRLEAPVLSGTDDRTLDRGVGHIEDTADPGTDGNSGLAGHRDGFFRGLKDISTGDAIELDTLHGTDIYRVERTWVVDPEDISVLDPTSTRALTLVTCYPFYYIGAAPRRFIVRAVLAPDESASGPPSTEHVLCPLCGRWWMVAGFRSSRIS